MIKKEYRKKISFIILAVILAIIIGMPRSLATVIRPSDITGNTSVGEIDGLEFKDDLINMLSTIGAFLAVGILIVIGIKYMAGSLEERASYKKSMVPYLIGCALIFNASIIAPQMIEIFKNAKSVEDVGNVAVGVVQVIGTFVAVGTLMILGIKYMLGSTEEKASYKKSMLPYLIGAILVFGSVNLTAAIVNTLDMDAETSRKPLPGTGNNCPYCKEVLTENEITKGRCSDCGKAI